MYLMSHYFHASGFRFISQARSWTFAIGFTLSIGGLTAKLWMAYSVLKERFVRSRVRFFLFYSRST